MLRSARGQNLIRHTPKERILTETDGPFVKMGKRPAQPSDIPQIVTTLGTLWGMGFENTRKQVFANFKNLLELAT